MKKQNEMNSNVVRQAIFPFYDSFFMTPFRLLSLIHLCLWCIHFSNILAVDGVDVGAGAGVTLSIASVCFISLLFFFLSFQFV